jgi:hypothetical protein
MMDRQNGDGEYEGRVRIGSEEEMEQREEGRGKDKGTEFKERVQKKRKARESDE